MQDTKTTNNETKKTLGRGLSSLFSENRIKKIELEGGSDANTSLDVKQKGESVSEIELDNLTASKFQPRTEFDEKKLRELRDSMVVGLSRPLSERAGVIDP